MKLSFPNKTGVCILRFLCLLIFYVGSASADVLDLYTDYYYMDEKELSDEKIKESLLNTLTRVSGEPLAVIHEKFGSLGKSEVISSMVAAKNQPSENPYWTLAFDAHKVQELIKKSNLLIWGSPRPVVSVMIRKQELEGEFVSVDDLMEEDLTEVISKVSRIRGVHFKPTKMLAGEGKWAEGELTSKRIWAELSETEGADYVATINLIEHEIFWRVEWQLVHDGSVIMKGRNSHSFSSTALESVLQQLVDAIQGFEKKQWDQKSRYEVVLGDVKDYDSYRKTLLLLQSSRWLEQLSISEFNKTQLVSVVSLIGEPNNYFQDMLKVGFNVIETGNPGRQGLRRVYLRYKASEG